MFLKVGEHKVVKGKPSSVQVISTMIAIATKTVILNCKNMV